MTESKIKGYPVMSIDVALENGDCLKLSCMIKTIEHTGGVNKQGHPLYKVDWQFMVNYVGNINLVQVPHN